MKTVGILLFNLSMVCLFFRLNYMESFAEENSITVNSSTKSSSVIAVTQPNYDENLSLSANGVIKMVHVSPGDIVKKDDLLVSLDDSVLQSRLALLKEQKDSTIQIRAAEAQLIQSQRDLERLIPLAEKGSVPSMELEEAQLNVLLKELAIEVARFEQYQAKIQYEEVSAEIRLMKIVAPLDGVVEELFVNVGKTVEVAEPVLRLVSTEPLWADVPVEILQASSLRAGAKVTVLFDHELISVEGYVLHVARVADSASQTRLVRLSILNPQSRPAGSQIEVILGDE